MGDITPIEGLEVSNKPTDKQLMPGKDSTAGFLAPGQTLDEVLKRDASALEVLGYSKGEMVELLNVCDLRESSQPSKLDLLKAQMAYRDGTGSVDKLTEARRNYNAAVSSQKEANAYVAPNGNRYPFRVVSWRGSQPCPWKDSDSSPNSSIDIFLKKPDGSEYHIPGMLKHLVEAHDFYEGGAYRCAPEDLVELLGTEKTPGSIEQAKQIPLPGASVSSSGAS